MSKLAIVRGGLSFACTIQFDIDPCNTGTQTHFKRQIHEREINDNFKSFNIEYSNISIYFSHANSEIEIQMKIKYRRNL